MVGPAAKRLALLTASGRRVRFSGPLSHAEVAAYGTCIQEACMPVSHNVQGVRSVTCSSGAGVGIPLTSMLTREGYDDVVNWVTGRCAQVSWLGRLRSRGTRNKRSCECIARRC